MCHRLGMRPKPEDAALLSAMVLLPLHTTDDVLSARVCMQNSAVKKIVHALLIACDISIAARARSLTLGPMMQAPYRRLNQRILKRVSHAGET